MKISGSKKWYFNILGIVMCFLASNCNHGKYDGSIVNEKYAIKLAEKVLKTQYGNKSINKSKPLQAMLKDGIWYVNGTLHSDSETIRKGGVPYIEIRQKDGKILNMYHTK